MINNRLVIIEDLVIILPICLSITLTYIILYCTYLARGLSKQCRPRWDAANTASHQGLHCLPIIQLFLDTTLGSKFYLFKFQIKYGKELRCLITKGKYGWVTDTEVKWSIISKPVRIIIFMEFINQIIDYPINCASLRHNTFPWRNKRNINNSWLRSVLSRATSLMTKRKKKNRPQGYKTFFMLDSAEHEICPANKSQITINCKFFLAKQAEHENFSVINMKMPTIVGIFIFISRENFMLIWDEHEKSFITLRPDWIVHG